MLFGRTTVPLPAVESIQMPALRLFVMMFERAVPENDPIV